MDKTNGIHHITAITADPQKNVDFYEGFLGQRLVKKTVNFDDPHAYHLYYGDSIGSPGSLITFFYWNGIRKGKRGYGEVGRICYTIKPTSLQYWKDRANKFHIPYTENNDYFGEDGIVITDPDGLEIGLVANTFEQTIVPWLEGSVPVEHVLRGFYDVMLRLPKHNSLDEILKNGLGYEVKDRSKDSTRFQTQSISGMFFTTHVHTDLQQAVQGYGSIHHIAFQANTDIELERYKNQLHSIGLVSTEPIDRQYFHSIYSMTPVNILFEIATNDIGFTIDENKSVLGEQLMLPPHFESYRDNITSTLTPLVLPRNY